MGSGDRQLLLSVGRGPGALAAVLQLIRFLPKIFLLCVTSRDSRVSWLANTVIFHYRLQILAIFIVMISHYDSFPGASFQLFLGGTIFFNFSMPPENWKKQHFICSNLTLFIVPFFLFFFFFFFSFSFTFFFFLGGRRSSSPLKWRPCSYRH